MTNLNATIHALNPPGGALKSIRSHNIISEISVDDPDHFRGWNVLCEKLCMSLQNIMRNMLIVNGFN